MSNSGSVLGNQSTVALDSIIATPVLTARPTRAPNYIAENDALISLAEKLAASPDDVLQKLAETALTLCHAQTAGISLLQPDGERFYWPALAGVWASHVGGSMPRSFSPCGTVLDRNAAQLMGHPERHYTYFAAVTPWIEEVLLIPFYVGAKAVGTIWVIVHDQSHRFDTEDLRLMRNLGTFASAAHQTLQSIKSAKLANEHLESEVERRTSDLRHLSAQLLVAEDVERRRLALELHDGAGQWLVALKWKLESLTQQIPEDIYRAMEAGAQGYILKEAPMEEIFDSIRAVARGGTWIPSKVGARLAKRVSDQELTPREREVLRELSAGKSNKEIGAAFDISEATVKVHVTHILNKLKVAGRSEAINAAVKRGLVRLD